MHNVALSNTEKSEDMCVICSHDDASFFIFGIFHKSQMKRKGIVAFVDLLCSCFVFCLTIGEASKRVFDPIKPSLARSNLLLTVSSGSYCCGSLPLLLHVVHAGAAFFICCVSDKLHVVWSCMGKCWSLVFLSLLCVYFFFF